MEKNTKEFITSLDSLTTQEIQEYSKKSTGVLTGLNNYTGQQIADFVTATYGDVKSITTEQLSYVLSFLMPSSYILKNHRIKNGKQRFTFSVPNYGDNDPAKALSHRPWQQQIINDIYPDVIVRKSRQLGLSELAVAFMLWWVDVHSQDGVNALYAFPTYRQMQDKHCPLAE